MRRSLVLPCLLAVALVSGCGSDDKTSPTATVKPASAGKRRHLPPGWERVTNRRAGFSLGLPPGWTVKGAPGTTVVRSADRALAISITADRSEAGRDALPGQYALATIRHLAGFRHLKAARPVKVTDAPYAAASVTGSGTFTKTKVKQKIILFTLHQRGVAMFTLLVFRSARTPAGRYAKTLTRLVRTFHSEPPRT